VNRQIVILVLGRQRQPRADDRGFVQDRPVLVDEANVAVGLDEFLQAGRRLLAIGAVVIEEIHDGEIAVGISGHGRVGIVQDHVARDFIVVSARQRRNDEQRGGHRSQPQEARAG
jgi:hypothetical protein